MFLDIKYEDIDKLNNYILIDVRSPDEYKEATIPNAVNIPLFDNQERATIGTLYKEKGPEAATNLGVKIVSPKIPDFINNINRLKMDKTPVFFCWRGGMRSKTMATIYDLVYPDNSYRLTGGYRAYREFILDGIEKKKIIIPTFVLHGMTGVGKTRLLYELKKMGLYVIDLEGLAGHRGSIFGSVGNMNPVNQKSFDSYLFESIKNIDKADSLIIEAESQRIGKVLVPNNIMEAKEQGYHILVSASQTTRINRIIEEYQPDNNKVEIYEAIKKLEKRLPTEQRKSLLTAYEENNFSEVVSILLEHYYDPRYQYSTDQYQGPFFEVNSDDLSEAANIIYNFVVKTVKDKKTILV